MIESIQGVKDLEKIVKTKRLDAIIIGKYDLELSFKNNSTNFKRINEIIDYIFKVAKKNKIVYGIHIVENKKGEVEKFKKRM